MIEWKKGFANFILETGLVDKENLDDAISIQRTTRPPIGEFALDKKWLTREKIFKILNAQKEPEGKGKLFGEVAIELEFLDVSQVSDLVISQNYPATFIGEILLSQKTINRNQLICALTEFNTLIKEDSEIEI